MYRNKLILSAIGLISFCGVCLALISQYVFDMPPCAWCVFQRLIYLTISAMCLAGVVGQPSRSRISVFAAIVLALCLGGVTAAWYQANVAAQAFSCAQTFADQVMTQSGLDATMPWLFGIFASCMDAKVTVLGLEYAYWSLILFMLLGAFATVILLNSTRKR
jgi:disulfide bond formation protein DsbB